MGAIMPRKRKLSAKKVRYNHNRDTKLTKVSKSSQGIVTGKRSDGKDFVFDPSKHRRDALTGKFADKGLSALDKKSQRSSKKNADKKSLIGSNQAVAADVTNSLKKAATATPDFSSLVNRLENKANKKADQLITKLDNIVRQDSLELAVNGNYRMMSDDTQAQPGNERSRIERRNDGERPSVEERIERLANYQPQSSEDTSNAYNNRINKIREKAQKNRSSKSKKNAKLPQGVEERSSFLGNSYRLEVDRDVVLEVSNVKGVVIFTVNNSFTEVENLSRKQKFAVGMAVRRISNYEIANSQDGRIFAASVESNDRKYLDRVEFYMSMGMDFEPQKNGGRKNQGKMLGIVENGVLRPLKPSENKNIKILWNKISS